MGSGDWWYWRFTGGRHAWPSHDANGRARRSYGSTQSARSNDMGAAHEQHPEPGVGDCKSNYDLIIISSSDDQHKLRLVLRNKSLAGFYFRWSNHKVVIIWRVYTPNMRYLPHISALRKWLLMWLNGEKSELTNPMCYSVHQVSAASAPPPQPEMERAYRMTWCIRS